MKRINARKSTGGVSKYEIRDDELFLSRRLKQTVRKSTGGVPRYAVPNEEYRYRRPKQSARKSTGGVSRYAVSDSDEEYGRPKQSVRKSTGGVRRYEFSDSDEEYGRPKQTVRKSTGGVSNYNIPKSRKTPEELGSNAKRVLESHLDLLKQGKYSDVTFIVGEEKERIGSHQLFLKARSDFFADMFSSEDWNQDTDKEVPLEDVRPETFKQFLEFIYADTFEAEDVAEALELLDLACKFDVKLLISECEGVLESEMTLDDALHVFLTARTYEMPKLMNRVGELWAESLSELETHPSFPQLDKKAFMYILRRADLGMEEVDLFRLALKWAGHQKDSTVERSLEDVLPLIRFPIMTLHEFTATVVPTKLLAPSTVIEMFTYFGSDDETRKSLAGTLGFITQERQMEPIRLNSSDSSSRSSEEEED